MLTTSQMLWPSSSFPSRVIVDMADSIRTTHAVLPYDRLFDLISEYVDELRRSNVHRVLDATERSSVKSIKQSTPGLFVPLKWRATTKLRKSWSVTEVRILSKPFPSPKPSTLLANGGRRDCVSFSQEYLEAGQDTWTLQRRPRRETWKISPCC